MMVQTLAVVYDSVETAQRVIHDLIGHGFPHRDISIVTNDTSSEFSQTITKPNTLKTEGATGGALIGGLTGLLIGLGALTIPGVGPAIAAGPLFGVIGAGTGAMTGGLLGALVDLGIPEQNAEYYAEAVRRGATLLLVAADEKLVERATQILNRHNPTNIPQLVTRWKNSGWSHFDPQGAPLSPEQINQERNSYTNAPSA